MNKTSRRNVLKNLAGNAALLSTSVLLPGVVRAELEREQFEEDVMSLKLKGHVNHSVCKWCYPNIPLDDLCRAAKDMGLSSIELQGPEEWPTIKKYGLTCAMP
jgi:hydroxypyruvate isomerase